MLEKNIDTPLPFVEKISRRHRRGTLAGFALLLAAQPIAIYGADILYNYQVEAESSVDIDIRGEAIDESNNNSALIFFNGFGTNNASVPVKYVGPAMQDIIDGQLWSVDYGNAPLNAVDITRHILEEAEKQNVTRVSLIGYSAGGIIAIEVAKQLTAESSLSVELITAISTPDGIDGLQQDKQEEMSLTETIALIPGATHSTHLRYVGEMFARQEQFTQGTAIDNITDFNRVSNHVLTALKDNRLPQTWLLVDQALAIANADLSSDISSVRSNTRTTRPLPVMLYLSSPGSGMVNDSLSAESICNYAAQNNIECYTYEAPGAIHSRIDLGEESYNEALAQAKHVIINALERSKDKAAITNGGSTAYKVQ